MGKKYAVLIVKNDEVMLEEFERSLTHSLVQYDDIKNKVDSLELNISESGISSIISILGAITKNPQAVNVKKASCFYLIDDENLSFETIDEEALRISCMLEKRVFYISVFDDDILVSGIYNNGVDSFLFRDGDCDVYCMEKVLTGKVHLYDFFSIKCEERDDSIFSSINEYESFINRITGGVFKSI